jgi:eukaryotic-like serine/threonine-protein kinase
VLGQTLLHYQITAKLGQGGMGEVYRATDTKLDREVAIKVLPTAFAQDRERLARFEREAKVLAQLNHPNIASVHGFDQHEGTRFLVMEHVDGEDLSQRLKRGPLSVDESIEIGKQIAEGLEAAHAKGIIHRDLKPANIKVSSEGQVKVLDFGLAKATVESAVPSGLGEAQASGFDSDSPTITNAFTQPGTILGTAAYMSPEQAKGKAVDQRTDVWAFGCVLFECLTGSRAFVGEDATDTLAGIIKGEPDWKAVSRMPTAIRLLLRKCLAKDRHARLQSIDDARIDLDFALNEPEEERSQAQEPAGLWGGQSRGTLIVLLIITFLLGAGGVYVFTKSPEAQAESKQASRMTITLPHRVSDFSFRQRVFDVSRDGQFLAYVSEEEGGSHVFVRRLDESNPIRLPGASPAFLPEISPDGNAIAFVRDGELKRIPARGGDTKTLCNVGRVEGMSWEGDSIYFCKKFSDVLYRVSDQGGEVTELTVLSEALNRWDGIMAPYVLPDGAAVLFDGVIDETPDAILSYAISSKETKLLIENGSHPVYVETGHLLFVRSESLMVVPFDKDTLSIVGDAVPLLEDLRVAAHGGANVRMNDLGQLFFISREGIEEGESHVVIITEQGGVSRIANDVGNCSYVRLSHDGKRMAVVIQSGVPNDGDFQTGVYVANLDGSDRVQLSKRDGQYGFPIWSPDDEWIYYQEINGNWADADLIVWRRRVDRRGQAEQVYTQDRMGNIEFIDSTGTQLFFVEEASEQEMPRHDAGIAIIDLKAEPAVRKPWLDTADSEREAVLSSDGNWVAFASKEPGWVNRLYVCPINQPDAAIQLTDTRSLYPFWSQDGLKLFYATGHRGGRDLTLKSIELEPSEAGPDGDARSLTVSSRSEITKLPNRILSPNALPDGQGIIATVPALSLENDPAVIHVMLHADERLRTVAPFPQH